MNAYFWIGVLFVWVLGLTIAFIVGIISDVKNQNYSSEKEKKKKIREMIILLSCNIIGFVLVWLEQSFFKTNVVGFIIFTSLLIFMLIQIIINTKKKNK